MGLQHRPGHGEFRRRMARLLVITGAATLLSAVAAAGAAAAAGPAGFWSGTDSAAITIPGPAPYREPVLGGPYGGYIGMAGNWANLAGCHESVVWSAANSAQADASFAGHYGIGTGVYWFMGGPGVDPHYNGTTGEAYAWGEQQ